jgi:flagellar hook-length control protein FliK
MNATPAVSQTPIASDPAQLSSTASANSVNSGGKGGDFAAALSKAGAKPARKSVQSTAGNAAPGYGQDGGQLPVAGNPSPPPNPKGAASDEVGINSVGGGTVAEAKAADPSAAGASAAATGSAQGAQVVRVAPDSASAAPGITFSLDLLAGAGEPGVQGADNPGLAAPTQDSKIVPTNASVQELASAKAAAAGRATVSEGASVGIRSTAANAANAVSAATAANGGATSAPSIAASGAAAQADAAASDPTSLGATAAVMVAVTGAAGDNSTTADATLSPAADSAVPAGSTLGAAAASGAPGPGIPVVAGRLPAAAAAASVTAASGAALPTASAGATAADKHARSDGGDSLPSDASTGSAGAAQLSVSSPGTATPGAVDAAPAPTLKIAAGVDGPEFGQGLADRLSWMVDNNVSSAKLQVNPPQLGPIEVRIALQGDHAQVWLVSHSAVTRDALQSSSPNLREILGAQGFGQVSVDISQRDFQDRTPHAQPYERTPAAMTASAPAITAVAASLPRLSSGAVDAYA